MSQSHSTRPTPLGAFSSLPLEIRETIYAFVFPTSPTLSLASKTLKAETERSLYQHGIYRTHITFHRATTGGEAYTYYTCSDYSSASAFVTLHHPYTPAPATLALIQNIDICIDMPEPDTSYSYGLWTHHTWGPGGFITDVVERIIGPMKSRKSCRLTFVLGSVVELNPYHEPRILDYFVLLRAFKTTVVELRKRPWIGRYPPSFGKGREAEDDVAAMRLAMLKEYLGYGEEMQEVDGNRAKVKIVRSDLGSGEVEVLWDSTKEDSTLAALVVPESGATSAARSGP